MLRLVELEGVTNKHVLIVVGVDSERLKLDAVRVTPAVKWLTINTKRAKLEAEERRSRPRGPSLKPRLGSG